MTLLDPASSIANLIYIGYPADITSSLQKTPQRRRDRRKQLSRRNVFQCYVFGPKGAGKSTFLNSFIGRCVFYSDLVCCSDDYVHCLNLTFRRQSSFNL